MSARWRSKRIGEASNPGPQRFGKPGGGACPGELPDKVWTALSLINPTDRASGAIGALPIKLNGEGKSDGDFLCGQRCGRNLRWNPFVWDLRMADPTTRATVLLWHRQMTILTDHGLGLATGA